MNMMCPRLNLARNVLRDKGFVVVPIDDQEVHHLRLMMNEVFGEATITPSRVNWRNTVARRRQPSNGWSPVIPAQHDRCSLQPCLT